MQKYYLQKADENLPRLFQRIIKPSYNSNVLKSGDTVTLDLGNHYVGYFSFKMWYVDEYIDAPVRMSVRFCETEREIDADYTDYRSRLCKSWLQEEIINVDFPGIYKMPRRYAARYIKIKILNTPKKLSLYDFVFRAETSASVKDLKQYSVKDEELTAIDRVAVNTLKNCMQRVFEDGPKRDRRLWTGDLRLEALANYYTFGLLKGVFTFLRRLNGIKTELCRDTYMKIRYLFRERGFCRTIRLCTFVLFVTTTLILTMQIPLKTFTRLRFR